MAERSPAEELGMKVCSKVDQHQWTPLYGDVLYLAEKLGYGVTQIRLHRSKDCKKARVVAVDRRGNITNERPWR